MKLLLSLSHSRSLSSAPPTAAMEGETPPDWTTTAIIILWPTDVPSVLELFRTRAGWTYIFCIYTLVSRRRRRSLRFPAKNRVRGPRSSHSRLTPIRPCWKPTCSPSCWSRWRFWYRTRYGRDSGSHWNTDRYRRTCRLSRKTFGVNFCFHAALRWNILEVPIY